MREAERTPTTSGRPSPLPDIIALEGHADRDLLLFCACLVRMREQLEALERAIACIPAVTAEGRRFKEMSL